ncbi:dTDP-4-dehydrorhamnose reductase [Altererythrobacter lutimaris]|uniref:dTDP-4-dehydrorhamnose reductase n=1 Tax=Altererythrobacter lutimaris TaxID=2743979 RepID=A0A850HDK4_9SPHN|nr:dTDP-4-dehydrorhamnose reductase [Altererythrobacter lutimaris]NVE95720.1 dTDP-4-dehydrorhamnose reductase [Altererythrobacter lutimaris]
MKVLIFGAGGQVGASLLATAPAKYTLEGAARADCDLSSETALEDFIAAREPALIINAAAYTAVDAAESHIEECYAINRDAVGIMAHALQRWEGKLVHLSTDYVFDCRSSRPYLPDDHRHALGVYGKSKAAGEDALRRGDLLVRGSWIYSAGGANFVTTMLRLMSERDEVRVVADQIGAPTWATGLAKTIWGLIAAEANGTFHHSDAGVASWYDFAVAIQEEARAIGLLERSIPIIPIASSEYPTAARRPAFSLLDSSATRDLLGDGYTHWRDNLRKMLKEEQALG